MSAEVLTVRAGPAVEMRRVGGGRALRFTMARVGRSSKAPLREASSRRTRVSERKEKRALPQRTVEAAGADVMGVKRVCEQAGTTSSKRSRWCIKKRVLHK